MFRPTPAALGAFRATSRAAFNKPAFQPHFGSVNSQYAFKWVPSLFFWGATGGMFVTIAMSGVPLFKTDVLLKTPVASFFEGTYCMTDMADKTPDCDKPF